MKPQSKPIEDIVKTLLLFLSFFIISCSPPEEPVFQQKNIVPPTVPSVLIPMGFHGYFDPVSLPQAQSMIITGTTIELHLEGNQDGLKNVYHYNFNNPKVHFDSTIITITEKNLVIVISKIVNSQDLYVTIKKPSESILLGEFLKQ